MTSSDKIAIAALIVSIITFVYTWFSSYRNTKASAKKEQINYLKSLSRMIKSFVFTDDKQRKWTLLDTVREELIFCTCYSNEASFQVFSEKLDDDVYMLCSTEFENNFVSIKERVLNNIQNFKK